MVAENECLKNEEGPFPEPTPEERDLPLGKRGELAAVRFLSRKGYEILETNWTCVAGEADIVALEEDTLCFVEVKTRSNVEKGFPAEAVDAKKRDRYERIAACYLATSKTATYVFGSMSFPFWCSPRTERSCGSIKMRLEWNRYVVPFFFGSGCHHSRS